MDDILFTSNDALQPESSHNGSKRTGLTLVLPPLSVVRALKAKKKAKGVGFRDQTPVPKAPRPLKLKPLKTVLSRLIVQIKRKDDYAFFLTPVDATLVPGYADIIQHPMDFGTITKKVEKGRYRTLEEFANDVRLVTTNAKTFNPPGTIYHTEAERIETYAIDHINRAAATVIEYEGDWNIDIERDDDTTAATNDDDDEKSTKDVGTPMDVDGSTRGRSPSVATTPQTPLLNGHSKNGKGFKKQPGELSESLEPDGHLPGYKDGLGVFPPGSDWADRMLALKLKGKRYRTKKERLRMERGGPPYHADGSLDYPEMEEPFSVLSALIPDPPSKPQLSAVFQNVDPSFPSTVNLFLSRQTPTVSLPSPISTATGRSRTRRRHWNIVRNTAGRRRDKEHEEDEEPPSWTTPRDPHPTDYGVFSQVTGQLANEYRVPDAVGQHFGSERQVSIAIKQIVDHVISARNPALADDTLDLSERGYWLRRGRPAEEYLRDVVYGGLDGYAYVRSVAEFVAPSTMQDVVMDDDDMEIEAEDEKDLVDVDLSLGMPLARYVEEHIVDPLTDGRHRLLRETAKRLANIPTPVAPTTDAQLAHSLHTLPTAARALVELRKVSGQQLDMGVLIRAPDELFVADTVWAGRAYAEEERKKREAELEQRADGSALQYLQFAVQTHEQAQAGASLPETREMLEHALNHSADLILELAQKKQEKKKDAAAGAVVKSTPTPGAEDGNVKMEEDQDQDHKGDDQDSDDVMLQDLRMNLLALAKRAPLDKIARLPADLVPEPIRHIVPTIEPRALVTGS